jgi:hypothetical protein
MLRYCRIVGFDSRQEQEAVQYFTAPSPALGPTQPPKQMVPGAFPSGAEQAGREADHPLASSAEVKNGGAIQPLPNTSS